MVDCPQPARGGLALVLTGGGARAAYQVGFLRRLARRMPDLRIPIITGVSAGAINAAYLASHPGTLVEATEGLARLWSRLRLQDVLRVDSRWLVGNFLRWIWRLSTGGGSLAPQVRGLTDTQPLRELLTGLIGDADGKLGGVGRKLESGELKSLALLTVNYATGQTVTWVEGCQIQSWERPNRISREAELTIEHVMASSALPFIFPAVKLERQWYGDGGIRHAAPLAPAIHLGADRILAVSSAYGKRGEQMTSGYPPPAQIAGGLLNAIFLDVLEDDAHHLERINELIRKVPGDARDELREVDLRFLRPSVNLGQLSAEFEPQLPKAFRFLTRSLGTRETSSPDVLSLLMFQPDYLTRLLEIGEADAEANLEALVPFLEAGG